MATTLGDIHLRLAYNLDENAVPNEGTEKSKRTALIQQGWRHIFRETLWWFTKTSDTLSTVADQEAYTLMSDFRHEIDVRIDGKKAVPMSEPEAFQTYDYPPTIYNLPYADDVATQKYYVYGENTIHFIPIPSSTGTNNISVKYYKNPTLPSADADDITIPDEYSDILVFYAEMMVRGKHDMPDGKSDAAEMYNEIYKQMVAENNRRNFRNKAVRARSIHEILE